MSANLRSRIRGESGKIRESDGSRENQENHSSCSSRGDVVVVKVFSALRLPGGRESSEQGSGLQQAAVLASVL